MKYNVFKGNRKHPELDSTHSDRGKATDRAKTLRDSLRGKPVRVWIELAEEGAPNFRRPGGGPWTNYDKGAPPFRVDGRRN